jgi:hypothetical protein
MYRMYMAYEYQTMDGAMAVPVAETRYALTDDAFDGLLPDGQSWKLVWSGGPYRLWEPGDTRWALLCNVFHFEGGAVRCDLVASKPGLVVHPLPLQSRPAVPGPAGARFVVSGGAGDSAEASLDDGPVFLPLRAGFNRTALRPAEQPEGGRLLEGGTSIFGIGLPWATLFSEAPSPHRLSVPAVPVETDQMSWAGRTGEALGDAPKATFALPARRFVYAIRLKCSYLQPADDTPVTLQMFWARDGVNDFTGGERQATLELPGGPGEKTLLVPVNDRIDRLRIDPDQRPCVFRVSEITAFVQPEEEPRPDTGGGEGTLDSADDRQIAGWAWDRNQPNSPIAVDIYDGDALLLKVTAGQFRQDLREAGIGNGKHAFSLPTPPRLRDGRVHVIRAKTSGTNRELSESPKEITLSPSADPYERLKHRIREAVGKALPSGATVLVVSKGDDDLLQLGGRKGRHFPPADAGHPADSQEAIKRLEAERARGAGYLLLPEPAFWWLDHYKEFTQYLERHARRIHGDADCIIYRLAPPKPG